MITEQQPEQAQHRVYPTLSIWVQQKCQQKLLHQKSVENLTQLIIDNNEDRHDLDIYVFSKYDGAAAADHKVKGYLYANNSYRYVWQLWVKYLSERRFLTDCCHNGIDLQRFELPIETQKKQELQKRYGISSTDRVGKK